MPTLRVVLDTNVLVSGIAYPGGVPGRIVRAWRQGSLVVALSGYILSELSQSLSRVNHRLKWTQQEIEDEVDALGILAVVVEPVAVAPGSVRDRSDLLVLGTLLASKADYLITGDKDLLALAGRYPAIVTPAEFWRKHGS
ncbi:MAG: putative toxin-antitoxin system toxin component, PIN family [Burkholderiales bacterium]|nr:putative toxin-antitoxin system toxin component, PIN family [Burkholderiales bacterium]